MAEIIGRKEEMAVLKSAIASKEAELIAIYGRRRIGNISGASRFDKQKHGFTGNVCTTP